MTKHMLLRACYAMCGTEAAYGATRRRGATTRGVGCSGRHSARYAMSGTDIADNVAVISDFKAMELANVLWVPPYEPTRLLGTVRY
eukprot:1329789-Rhodomonas_salina.1